MSNILSRQFFNRPADTVAKEILGATLCVSQKEGVWRGMIHEVEAYLGEEDKACHASKGRTKRTEIMYGEPGTLYAYLIYGMYWMLNIVTMPAGVPHAVLIRGAGEFDGPGKLTKTLLIGGEYNGKMLGQETLWIEEGDEGVAFVATPRVGIDYAEEWAKKPLRFIKNPPSTDCSGG
jgi:DNA-3-methyladenine glycosylase